MPKQRSVSPSARARNNRLAQCAAQTKGMSGTERAQYLSECLSTKKVRKSKRKAKPTAKYQAYSASLKRAASTKQLAQRAKLAKVSSAAKKLKLKGLERKMYMKKHLKSLPKLAGGVSDDDFDMASGFGRADPYAYPHVSSMPYTSRVPSESQLTATVPGRRATDKNGQVWESVDTHEGVMWQPAKTLTRY